VTAIIVLSILVLVFSFIAAVFSMIRGDFANGVSALTAIVVILLAIANAIVALVVL
jgi:hypothetical protein